MRKVIPILVALLAMWQSTFAQDFSAVAPSGQTLYYSIFDTNVAVVKSGDYITNLTGNLIIPSNVTYNGNTYAVTSIFPTAFQFCRNLTSVVIPNTVTSIGTCAFHGCFGLTSITIPNSVTSIEISAFDYCIGLTSITIPNSVIEIWALAFSSCSGLTEIHSQAITPPDIDSSATFKGVSKSIPLYVLCGRVSAYQSDSLWSQFTNIQEEGCTTS